MATCSATWRPTCARVGEDLRRELLSERPQRAETPGATVDDLREAKTHAKQLAAIPLLSVALQDLATDLPVHLDELRVDRPRSPRLSAADATLNVLEELLVDASLGM